MRGITSFLTILVALALFAGCSSTERAGELVENQRPTVWLSAAPPEGTVSHYKVHLYWGGWDPDGEISYYEYVITDNGYGTSNPTLLENDDDWQRVYRNDSVFVFTADELGDPTPDDMVAEFQQTHTFYIRSVDEHGLHSSESVHRSFTASTLSPEVNITIPRRIFTGATAIVPSIVTIRWRATDHDGSDLFETAEPESVQHLLISTKPFANSARATLKYLRTDPSAEQEWEPWRYYKAPGDSGKFFTSDPLDRGSYVFAVRAKDEAGAVTPVLEERSNVRFLKVAPRSLGPLLAVANEFLGTVNTASCNAPIKIMEYASGLPISFSWCADAGYYGGEVASYRYGWDIADLDDSDQWEIDFTPFTTQVARSPDRTFFFGTHVFTVEVIDNNNKCSRQEIKVNIIRFTFERDLLLVDDFAADTGFHAGWANKQGNGIMPNDEEHDEFWRDMLANAVGFIPGADEIAVESGESLSLSTIAPYKCIVWNVDGNIDANLSNVPKLYDFIAYRQNTAESFCPTPEGGAPAADLVEPNFLRLYMKAGGRVLIAGNHPVSQAVKRDLRKRYFPYLMRYDVEGNQGQPPEVKHPLGDNSFGYQDLCVDVLDFAYLSSARARDFFQVCPVVDFRSLAVSQKRVETMRGAIAIDPDFAALSLRPECAALGRYYEESHFGLDVEVYNPAYFFSRNVCEYSPSGPRSCFEPIYGLKCLDSESPVYGEAVAFWIGTYSDVIPDETLGATGRSAVFGFPPVMFNPEQVRLSIEHILFNEWQLPHR